VRADRPQPVRTKLPTIHFPQLIDFLISLFGWRGACLALSGFIALLACCAPWLSRPNQSVKRSNSMVYI
jgi:hypothetical protein